MKTSMNWIAAIALLPWLVGCGADDNPTTTADPHSHEAHETGEGDADEHRGGGHDNHDSHSDHGSHPSHGSEGHDETHASHGSEGHGESHASHGSEGHGETSHDHGTGSHAAEQPLADNAKRPAAVEPNVKIKGEDGEEKYSIKWKDDGAKLVDADEREIARFNASPGKLKVKDPDDQVIGYIVGSASDGRLKVEDPTQEKERFKLIRQTNGDWKLEDGAEKMLVRIKKREYGAELESPNDSSLYKVKVKDGKTSLRNAADKTVLYTKNVVSPMGFACLGLDAIKDVRLRAALLVQMQSH